MPLVLYEFKKAIIDSPPDKISLLFMSHLLHLVLLRLLGVLTGHYVCVRVCFLLVGISVGRSTTEGLFSAGLRGF